MRRHLKRDNIGRYRHGFSSLPCLKLSAMRGQIGRCVQELPVAVRVPETAARTELAKSIIYFGMQRIGQFAGEKTTIGTLDEGFDGGQQRAVTRKPDSLMRPETLIIKASNLGKRVIAAAMGIAGQVVQRAEFPENGDIGCGAERLFQLGKIGNLVSTQVPANNAGIESGRSHNDRITTGLLIKSQFYHNGRSGQLKDGMHRMQGYEP